MKSAGVRYGDTNFVTGMRAFAALGVVMVHTGGAGLRQIGPVGNRLADLGSAGVYVFFVISGFAVSQSFFTSKSYKNYLIKRLLRIAPLYYFWLLICTAIVGGSSPYNFATHLLFISFLDLETANSLIGVEWSIPIEVFYYLIVPIFLIWARGPIRIGTIIVASFIILLLGQLWASSTGNSQNFLRLHWSPIPYGFCFALGIAAFFIKKNWSPPPWASYSAWSANLGFIACYAAAPAAIQYLHFETIVWIPLLTFAALVTTTDRNNCLATNVLLSRQVQFIGLLSYGLYLSHVPIHRVIVAPLNLNATLSFAVTSAAALSISLLTFALIERPMQSVVVRFDRYSQRPG